MWNLTKQCSRVEQKKQGLAKTEHKPPIGLITVFDAILTGRQSKSSRLHSPTLKDVAWLEDVQLTFLIFHAFVYKFCRVDKRLDVVRGKKS